MEHENLIQARKKKGLTQKEMADMLAMEQTTYSKKERGISRIREEEWVQFSKILEQDIDDLKSKDQISINNVNFGHSTYFKIIETIIRYNQKLEEENSLLKEQLKK
jgi:transcriptional regulator with XRE-family HTH domain